MRVVCELCEHDSFIKRNGLFECECCKTKYTLEEAKKLLKTEERSENTIIPVKSAPPEPEVLKTEDGKYFSFAVEIRQNKCDGYTSVISGYTSNSSEIIGVIEQNIISENDTEALKILLENSVNKIYAFENAISLVTMVVPGSFTQIQQNFIESYFNELKIKILFLGRCSAAAHYLIRPEHDKCFVLFIDVCSTCCETEVIEFSKGVLKVLSRSVINDFECDTFTFKEVWKNISQNIYDTITEAGVIKELISEIICSGEISENAGAPDTENAFENKMIMADINDVALGAAVYSANMSGELHTLFLMNASPYRFGFKNENDEFVTVIDKNCNIPSKKDIIYSVKVNDKKQIDLDLFVCCENDQKEYMRLGECRFSEISTDSTASDTADVNISFALDTRGNLTVSIYQIDDDVYSLDKELERYSFKMIIG